VSDSPTSEPEPDFACDGAQWIRSDCAGEPFYKEHEGKRYCVLHLPCEEKSADFALAFENKLDKKEFNFRGVWFPDNLKLRDHNFAQDVDFEGATFNGYADFHASAFRAKANFDSAIFCRSVSFTEAIFGSAASFHSTRFNSLADFGGAQFDSDVVFSEATFSDEAEFSSVLFHEATFIGVTFKAVVRFTSTFRGYAWFLSATFSGRADFGTSLLTRAIFTAPAVFSDATFAREANFGAVIFGQDAGFEGANFGATAEFGSATFEGDARFIYTTFGAEANFLSAVFRGKTDFTRATISEHVRFLGDGAREVFSESSELSLRFAYINKPMGVSFDTVTLRPHWFINVDSREFKFKNVDWIWRSTNQEVHALAERNVLSPCRMLEIACRNLAANADENSRYEEASRFRYKAMEARRLETWRGFVPWRLGWWYWLASGYSERVLRAFLFLLGIWFVAAILYAQVGFARWEPKRASESDVAIAKQDDIGAPLKFSRALTYSASVMTLQKPEPKPATTAAQTVVLLETLLGPVQAALLGLAIRRKFMR
jgi:hypothetical protein